VIAPETLSHDQAAELLPWLVNDSLSDRERDAVRAHASSCVVCRRELEELAEIRNSITLPAAGAPVPAPDMRRINSRIDDLIRRQTRGRRLLERLREWFGDPWRVAVALQTVVLLTLGTAWLATDRPGPEYTTLTTPDALPEGQYLRVVLDPTLDTPQVAAFFDAMRLSVVDGPSARGVYTVSPDERDAEIDRIATDLLNDPAVLFAQPVTSEEVQ